MAAIAYPTLGTAPRRGAPAGASRLRPATAAGPRPARAGSPPRPARPGRPTSTHLRLVGAPMAAQPGARPGARPAAPVGRRPAHPRPSHGARLRRLGPGATTLAVLVGCWFGAGALAGAGGGHLVRLPGSRPVPGGYAYVVRPGDTLWSLAARLEPGSDPRPLMDRLSGQLQGGKLLAGAVLVVP